MVEKLHNRCASESEEESYKHPVDERKADERKDEMIQIKETVVGLEIDVLDFETTSREANDGQVNAYVDSERIFVQSQLMPESELRQAYGQEYGLEHEQEPTNTLSTSLNKRMVLKSTLELLQPMEGKDIAGNPIVKRRRGRPRQPEPQIDQIV